MTDNRRADQVSINIFDQIDSICADFRRQWKAGKRPQIEDYLDRVAESAREQLFRNLLTVEIRYRERADDRLTGDEYLTRFPQFKRAVGDALHYSTSVSIEAMQSTPADGSHDLTMTFEAPAAKCIGDYELIRELGRGGFGVVYEAKHVKRGHRVALKTLPTGTDGQEGNAERLHKFRREFRSLSEINHPNLVGMQTLEVDGSQWFFTMDLVDGVDFFSYVRPDGRLHEERLRESLRQLISGIIALHDQRILARPRVGCFDQFLGDTLRGRTVTIDAGNFNRGADLAVQFCVAVNVLIEVAVDAMHPFLEMNVHHVHGGFVTTLAFLLLFICWRDHCSAKLFVGHFGNNVALVTSKRAVVTGTWN